MVRIKISHSFVKVLKNIKVKYTKKAAQDLKNKIIEQYNKGLSPVEGYGRFDKYSESYTKKIQSGYYGNKSVRPVNLKLTGKMHKSIGSKQIKNGFMIFFTDKKAIYHNETGAGGSMVIRKMLPGKGEKFSRTLNRHLNKLLVNIVKKEF